MVNDVDFVILRLHYPSNLINAEWRAPYARAESARPAGQHNMQGGLHGSDGFGKRCEAEAGL
jgi:hypothetical protein